MKKILFLLVCVYLFSFKISFSECIPILPDDLRLLEIVHNLERRLNIHSMKCNFLNNSFYPGKPPTDEEYQVINRTFIYRDKNFVLHSYMIFDDSNKKFNDTPRTLLEVLAYNYHKERLPLAYRMLESGVESIYYFNGVCSKRDRWVFKDGSVKIEGNVESNFEEWCVISDYGGDARINMGYVGVFLHLTPLYKNRLHILEFLKMEGPFYIEERDGYTVIWHDIKFGEYGDEFYKDSDLPLELWFNQDGDLVKIVEVFYLSRLYGLEKVKSLIGEKATCSFPYFKKSEYIFSEFRNFDNGIRIPMHVVGRMIKNIYDKNDPKYKELEDINNPEDRWIIINALIPRKEEVSKESEIVLQEDSIVINQPIADEEFIAPPVTEEEPVITQGKGKTNWLNRYKLYVFIFGCVLFTFIAMFITKRYWGWGT